MSKANYLTLTRLLVAPLFLWVYTQHKWLGIPSYLLPYGLLGLMTISEITDFCDGYIARKFNEVTDLGKILDPMADSISRTAVFLTFTTGIVKLPLYLPFLIFYREAVISTLRTVCALRGFALAARPSGKMKAVLQAVAAYAIVLAMIPQSMGWIETATLRAFAQVMVGIAVLYTLYSGVDYIMANWEHVKRLLIVKKPSEESSRV